MSKIIDFKAGEVFPPISFSVEVGGVKHEGEALSGGDLADFYESFGMALAILAERLPSNVFLPLSEPGAKLLVSLKIVPKGVD